MSGSFLGDAFGGRGGNNHPGWPMSTSSRVSKQLRTQFEQKASTTPRMKRGRAFGRALAAARAADARLPDHPRDRRPQRRSWEAEPRLGVPHAAAADRRGSRAGRGVERSQDLLASPPRVAPRPATRTTERTAPWESAGSRDGGRMTALPKAGIELAQAAAQVGRTRATRSRSRKRSRSSKRRAVSSTPSSPRGEVHRVRRVRGARRHPGDSMTDDALMKARYRRITRSAARYLVQAWWYELFLPRFGLGWISARGRTRRPSSSASRSASTCSRSTRRSHESRSGNSCRRASTCCRPRSRNSSRACKTRYPRFRSGRCAPVPKQSSGCRWSVRSASIDERPLAAASLGQAHRAVLTDDLAAETGLSAVVLKIQRPGIDGSSTSIFAPSARSGCGSARSPCP